MAALRDVTEQLWPAVKGTLAALELTDADMAAAKLAQRYAQIIDQLPDIAPRGSADQAWALRWMGPLLLDCLVQLRATPAARQQPLRSGTPPPDATDALSQLRAAKAARRPR